MILPGAPGITQAERDRLLSVESGRPVIRPSDAAGGADMTAEILAGLNLTRGTYSDRNKSGGVLPAGTYKVNQLALAQSYQTLEGASLATVLKAAPGAAYALSIEGLRDAAVQRLTIDGNAKASHGLRIRALAGGPGSEQALIERVMLSNCDRAIELATPATGAINQSDKHTYIGCFFNASNVGMYLDAVNAQQQTLVGCHFENNATDITLVQGGVIALGGQFGGTGTGINIVGLDSAGAAIYGVDLIDVIMEGHALAINGSTGWPRNGVTMRGTTIGCAEAVRMGVNGRSCVLTAEHCDFATGNVVLNGDDAVFYDFYNQYREGATVVRNGARVRHVQRNANGLTEYYGNTIVFQRDAAGKVLVAPKGNVVPLALRGEVGQTANLFETRDGVNTLLTRVTANGELFIQTTASGLGAALVIFDNLGNPAGRFTGAGALQFEKSMPAASAANNSIFRDSADNVLKQKNNSGVVSAI